MEDIEYLLIILLYKLFDLFFIKIEFWEERFNFREIFLGFCLIDFLVICFGNIGMVKFNWMVSDFLFIGLFWIGILGCFLKNSVGKY